MMTRNGWITLACLGCLALALLGSRARASYLPPGVTCPDVRAAIATVAKQTGKTTEEAALIVEAMARAGGASDLQIETAKRCLPSSNR